MPGPWPRAWLTTLLYAPAPQIRRRLTRRLGQGVAPGNGSMSRRRAKRKSRIADNEKAARPRRGIERLLVEELWRNHAPCSAPLTAPLGARFRARNGPTPP